MNIVLVLLAASASILTLSVWALVVGLVYAAYRYRKDAEVALTALFCAVLCCVPALGLTASVLMIIGTE